MKGHRANTVTFKEVKAGLTKNGHKMEKQPAVAYAEAAAAQGPRAPGQGGPGEAEW